MRDESKEEASSGSVRSRKTRNEFSIESKLWKFYAVRIGFQPVFMSRGMSANHR
uniref:Uncharacterized protein n=1 Tax=Physcomitrium patens TaxID=3218 RepID=A0A2K1LAV3_PHYPA|nr:hypothetical protein PHYPA_001587 [Physcomitrium patens]